MSTVSPKPEPSRVFLDAKVTYQRGTTSVDAALTDRELERLILADDEADPFEKFNASERLRAIEEMLADVDRIAGTSGLPSSCDSTYTSWAELAALVKERTNLAALAIDLGFFLTPANKQGTQWHGPCPVCGGTDRWQVFKRGKGWRAWCRQCEWSADAIKLVQSYVFGCSHFRDAVTYLAANQGVAW